MHNVYVQQLILTTVIYKVCAKKRKSESSLPAVLRVQLITRFLPVVMGPTNMKAECK